MIGFNSEIQSPHHDEKDLLKLIEPEDLLKFGLIPELIGRLPVIVTLDELSEEAMVKIMKEPKNAIVKQYRKLFALDGVELELSEEAILAVAKKAVAQKTGARGLRTIFEKTMNDIMFEIPSRKDVRKCVVTKETIENGTEPELITGPEWKEPENELTEEVS